MELFTFQESLMHLLSVFVVPFLIDKRENAQKLEGLVEVAQPSYISQV